MTGTDQAVGTAPRRQAVLFGIGASRGVGRSGAVVVRSRKDLARVGADNILVVDVLPQDWATAIPACRAVVTQTGGLLQFSARVLRHRGIPAVVGVAGVLAEVEDGDEVEVDGSTGIVRVQLGSHRPSPRVA